jgi:alkanesulfonate monooxygenase SsuD/methylene tetrahydromethanopterin reductase-like flavin-dependent oxidoreductase (luciferase family)
MTDLPAISLVASPGRRRAFIDLAREAERRGLAGIHCPSPFGGMAFCEALSVATETIPFGISIAPIYARTAEDYAQSAAFLHEVSGGRFHFGIGVSHTPSHKRMGVEVGKPLADMRDFVTRLRAVEGIGDLPPLILAGLRPRMIALAGELGDGLVFANAARSTLPQSLAALPSEKWDDPDFYIGCMTPTCISDDVEAAKAVVRRILARYVQLPNYRNYWKDSGYREEMEAVERCVAEGRPDDIPACLHDRWLADVTLFGPAGHVRDELAAWREAGVRTHIIVPSSAVGNQNKAVEEVFAAFAG